MNVGDHIRASFFMEVDGNQSRVTHYFEVIDATVLTTLEQVLEDLHADWFTRIINHVSTDNATTCATWENLDGNDPTIHRFTTIAGLSPSDTLPPKDVWKFTEHALHPPADSKTSTKSISGFSEAVQKDSEWLGPLGDLYKTMVSNDIVMVAGPTLRPVVRYFVTDVELFQRTINGSENRYVKALLNRSPGLCRTN